MKKYIGFSLIEALVVLIIAAILATVAYPSFITYLRQTRRTYAITNLLKIQAQFEQYYIQNNSYPAAGTIAAAYGAATPPSSTYYAFGCSGCTTSAYTITATTAGDQVNDTDCAGGGGQVAFSLTNTGVKGAANSTGTSNVNVCWGT